MSWNYRQVTLDDGTSALEHRCVMQAHLGRPLLDTEIVHHADGDGRNNRIENLRVMSMSAHSELHSRRMSDETKARISASTSGEGNAFGRLKEAEVIDIRRLRSLGVPARLVAKMYRLCAGHVSDIVAYRSWAHVLPCESVTPTTTTGFNGSHSRTRQANWRLRGDEVREIRRLGKLGVADSLLRRMFRISRSQASKIRRRITWGSLSDYPQTPGGELASAA